MMYGLSQMTYLPVPFEVHGHWAWPPQGWDGESEFVVFDCAALWIYMPDWRRIEKLYGAIEAADGFSVRIDGCILTCYDGERHGVWKLTNEYDLKNKARLMVWPD